MTRQLEEEKAALLERKRQEQAERRRKQEELDRILLDNRRKVCCTAVSALGGARALTGRMVDSEQLCLRTPEHCLMQVILRGAHNANFCTTCNLPCAFMPSYSHSILSVENVESPSYAELLFSLSELLCSCLPATRQVEETRVMCPRPKSPALANGLSLLWRCRWRRRRRARRRTGSAARASSASPRMSIRTANLLLLPMCYGCYVPLVAVVAIR